MENIKKRLVNQAAAREGATTKWPVVTKVGQASSPSASYSQRNLERLQRGPTRSASAADKRDSTGLYLALLVDDSLLPHCYHPHLECNKNNARHSSGADDEHENQIAPKSKRPASDKNTMPHLAHARRVSDRSSFVVAIIIIDYRFVCAIASTFFICPT